MEGERLREGVRLARRDGDDDSVLSVHVHVKGETPRQTQTPGQGELVVDGEGDATAEGLAEADGVLVASQMHWPLAGEPQDVMQQRFRQELTDGDGVAVR